MQGPIELLRSDSIKEYENLGPIYEWVDGATYLLIDAVIFRNTRGVIFCYNNPPVHQISNPGITAYVKGIKKVFEQRNYFKFLILYGANDPVHAGGDLKESLSKIDRTLVLRREKEASSASPEEIDQLYNWAENDRLKIGIAFYNIMRKLSQNMRLVAVCGGGIRFGGSAEIPLMADILVGDSRSSMCWSEAMIGLISGWAGVARTLTKAGFINAKYVMELSKEIKADELKEIGIYNIVVDIPFSFPEMPKTGNREADKAQYHEELQKHNDMTGLILLPKGLELAICPQEEIPAVKEEERKFLATEEEISLEVTGRKDPNTYKDLWGKRLREVKKEIAELGKPLAPQSIEALERLFEGYDPSTFDEKLFAEQAMYADAKLYRDPRLRAGLTARLEQRVADFRLS